METTNQIKIKSHIHYMNDENGNAKVPNYVWKAQLLVGNESIDITIVKNRPYAEKNDLPGSNQNGYWSAHFMLNGRRTMAGYSDYSGLKYVLQAVKQLLQGDMSNFDAQQYRSTATPKTFAK